MRQVKTDIAFGAKAFDTICQSHYAFGWRLHQYTMVFEKEIPVFHAVFERKLG